MILTAITAVSTDVGRSDRMARKPTRERATKHSELVAQDEDLQLLPFLAAKQEHDELQDATQRPIEEGNDEKLRALGFHKTEPYAPTPCRLQTSP
jgi:hypothetical protein